MLELLELLYSLLLLLPLLFLWRSDLDEKTVADLLMLTNLLDLPEPSDTPNLPDLLEELLSAATPGLSPLLLR